MHKRRKIGGNLTVDVTTSSSVEPGILSATPQDKAKYASTGCRDLSHGGLRTPLQGLFNPSSLTSSLNSAPPGTLQPPSGVPY
jgi:hypothetical protein